MSVRAQVSSSVLPGLSAGAGVRSSVADIAAIRPRTGIEVRASVKAGPKQRSKIWDLHGSLHCSIIGTCLTTGELRRLLMRLRIAGADAADDHDLHMLGVLLAARPEAGAKHLQKTLDRRHQTAIHQFGKAKDAQAVGTLWQDAMKRGDIPGAYWAVLTHPETTDTMVKQVFGEVHMLSHLVGAANRADIQRLRSLEEHNAELAAKLERQQAQLRDGFTARDATIRRLSDALAAKASESAINAKAGEHTEALAAALAERDRRLSQEVTRREKAERRLEAMTAERDEARRDLAASERASDALQAELASMESQIGSLLDQTGDRSGAALDLLGLTVLYVGGRAHQTPLLKGLVERMNGRFLHHDGGLEHNVTLLPGLVSRADVAVFPVDCVSHDSVTALKRLCRQAGRRYVPLRNASLTCLLSGIASFQELAAAAPDTVPA
jgi:Uncharacterized protein conserved in bacteria (DUF2325)